MNALETVRWRPLLDELAASLPDAGDTLTWCLERNRANLLPPLAMSLAVLTVIGGRPKLGRLVYEHTTKTGHEKAVADWMYYACRVAMRTLESPKPAVVPGPVEGLWRDPRLPALPLAHLALEWAETSALPLVVRLAELGPMHGGRTMRGTVVKVLIPRAGVEETKVDLVEISPNGDDIASAVSVIWLHEFSHVIDDRHDENPCDTEPFADRLGELLAVHRPATLAQVTPLMEQARRDLAQVQAMSHQRSEQATNPDVDLPAPGLPSLMALAGLPLQREGVTV